MAGLRLVAGRTSARVEAPEVLFLDAAGRERRAALSEVADATFETAPPVRSFPSYRGQRNYPGLWWSATSGRHVGFESWLERDHAMLLDFDPQVIGFAPQPFWLFWRATSGRERAHAPDWFARLADGTGVVIDCRPDDRIRQRDAEAFAAAEQACAEVGWRHQLVHGHDPVLVGNVRWLAGYRHPRHHDPAVAAALLDAFTQPCRLLDGVLAAGDPIGVLPVCYHLLWRHELVVDLTVPLHDDTIVHVAGAVR